MAFVWLEEVVEDASLFGIEIELESVTREVRTFQHGVVLEAGAMQIAE